MKAFWEGVRTGYLEAAQWTLRNIALLGLAAVVVFSFRLGQHWSMQEAFDRGHAVQCPGMTGYHWECGE